MQGQWFSLSRAGGEGGGQYFSVKSQKYWFSGQAVAPAWIYLPYKFMGGNFNIALHVSPNIIEKSHTWRV